MHARRTALVAVLIALQLLAALVALNRRADVPDAAPLRPDADRAGFIAVVDGAQPPCLDVIDVATVRRRQLTCEGAEGFAGWSSAGRILLLGVRSSPARVVDPVTGELTETDLERPLVGIPPVTVRTGTGDGRVSISIDDATVWERRVPKRYTVGRAEPSPDGRHAIAIDSDGRLLLVDVERPGAAAVVTTGVTRAAWYVPGRFPAAVLEAPPDGT